MHVRRTRLDAEPALGSRLMPGKLGCPGSQNPLHVISGLPPIPSPGEGALLSNHVNIVVTSHRKWGDVLFRSHFRELLFA